MCLESHIASFTTKNIPQMILWYYLSFTYSADKASYKWQYSLNCYLHTVLTKPRINGNMIIQYYRLTAWIIKAIYKRTFICTPVPLVKAPYEHSSMCILIILRRESIRCKRESIRCRRESIRCKRESIRCRNRAVRPRFWWQRKIPTDGREKSQLMAEKNPNWWKRKIPIVIIFENGKYPMQKGKYPMQKGKYPMQEGKYPMQKPCLFGLVSDGRKKSDWWKRKIPTDGRKKSRLMEEKNPNPDCHSQRESIRCRRESIRLRKESIRCRRESIRWRNRAV